MRSLITITVGSVIAGIGVVIFLCDRSLATPVANQLYSAGERNMFQILWAAFGIALCLAGAMIGALGFAAWCRDGSRNK
jgi:nitrate reductase NapE component